MTAKDKYRILCQKEPSIDLPGRDWWLDAVAGAHAWDVVVVEKNGEIVASLPYVLHKKLGFRIILMPPLTPGLGVWIRYPEGQKYASRLSYEIKVCDELIEQLPAFHRFHQRFQHRFTNWLPFYWRGFEQTTRYHYIIPNLSDLETVFAEFRENIRREIRKAQKRVRIYENDDPEKLYHLIHKTFERQNLPVGFSLEFLERIAAACRLRNCCKILFAEDARGRLHSGLLLVWDQQMAYYLQGGNDPDLRNSGAASLLMWEAIQFAATVTQQFNFAGSMIPAIERYFRGFGAVQTPYFAIYKNNHILFKLWQAFFRGNH